MSENTFTLDDLKASAAKKYASVFIDIGGDSPIEMLNALRLSQGNRTRLKDLQERLDDEGADHNSLLDEFFELVCATAGQAKALTKAVDGDLAVKMEIVKKYSGETEAGEASPSQD